MDTRVKGLWLDALRSGEFEQAKEKLADVDPETGKVNGYCCLGVLCELAVQEGVIEAPVAVDYYDRDDENARTKDRLLYGNRNGSIRDYSTSQLPTAVAEWAGIETSPSVEHPNPDYDPDADNEDDDEYGFIEPSTLNSGLAELNDDYEYDFRTIADLIEVEL